MTCPGCQRPVQLGPVQWKRFTLAQARFRCTACNAELRRPGVAPGGAGSVQAAELGALHAATQRALQLWNAWVDRARPQ